MKRLLLFLCVVHSLISTTSLAVSVEDYSQQIIHLKQPAKRVVVLAPHIVENLFYIGAQEKIVGVISHSTFPAQAASITQVGDYQKINLEKIIALQPDLVLAWQSGNKTHSINTLKKMGIPVYLDEAKTLEDIARSLTDLGKLLGLEEQANAKAQAYLASLASLKKQYQQRKAVSVFYQIWHQPLQTLNAQHIINDIIERCGGENIFAQQKIIAPVVSIESVVAHNPQVMIASTSTLANSKQLNQWLSWTNISAVKHNNLFYVLGDHVHRQTPRIIYGYEKICQQIDKARDNLSKSAQ